MRLLCAACLKAAVQARPQAPKRHGLARAGLALAGIFLAWIVLFCTGETIMTFEGRLEQPAWQSR